MLLPAFTGSVMPFQSTLPVRGATTRSRCCPGGACISIHAPRAGSDFPRPLSRVWPPYFNPRSPCGERRAVRFAARLTDSFQSTLPVRGATIRIVSGPLIGKISIHAPRAGSDTLTPEATIEPTDFNPRSPCGERRESVPVDKTAEAISIHAPRAGSDDTGIPHASRKTNISIHAPRAGSDGMPHRNTKLKCYFNPRSPCGERRHEGLDVDAIVRISIHAPRAGSDRNGYIRDVRIQ